MLRSADGGIEADWVGYIDTMLEYYLHIDPERLTDEEWAAKFARLVDIRKKEGGVKPTYVGYPT